MSDIPRRTPDERPVLDDTHRDIVTEMHTHAKLMGQALTPELHKRVVEAAVKAGNRLLADGQCATVDAAALYATGHIAYLLSHDLA